MAKWKLSRQLFGNCNNEKVLIFTEGDKITFGRGLDNDVTLPSIVISRNHCLLDFRKDEVSITDLKSSNGIYIGLKRIPANVPYVCTEKDLIGFGWTVGAPLAKVKDEEKYLFKLEKCTTSITDRLKFQDDVLHDIEEKISSLDKIKTSPKTNELSPVIRPRLQLKRKLQLKFENDEVLDPNLKQIRDDVINIVSDSDNETNTREESAAKKIKLETVIEEDKSITTIKHENEDFGYEAFNVKQEYFGYNDEAIEITSDSDSESEHWIRRLSQNSPGKALKSVVKERLTETQPEDGSYSQLDDVFEIDDEVFEIRHDDEDEDIDYLDDLIMIPPEPPADHPCIEENSDVLPTEIQPITIGKPNTELKSISDSNNLKDITKTAVPHSILNNFHTEKNSTKELENTFCPISLDIIDGSSSNNDHTNTTENILKTAVPHCILNNIQTELKTTKKLEKTLCPIALNMKDGSSPNNDHTNINQNLLKSVTPLQQNISTTKKTQMIEPLNKTTTKKSKSSKKDSPKYKSKSSHKSDKAKKESSSPKRKITDSQKEERKKKLKQIACKDKDKDIEESSKDTTNNAPKTVVNAKITTVNRGAFLSDVNQATIKPTKRKTSPQKEKDINDVELQTKNEKKIKTSKSTSKSKREKVTSNESEKTNGKCEQKSPSSKSTSKDKREKVTSDESEKTNGKCEQKSPSSKSTSKDKREKVTSDESKKSNARCEQKAPASSKRDKIISDESKKTSVRCEQKAPSKSTKKDKREKVISDELEKPKEQKAPVVKFDAKRDTLRGVDSDSRIPFKSLKPLTESEESCLGKPVSIVGPLPPKKPKKSVRFSIAPPTVFEFQIEPGNKMKKTSSVKTTLVDVHKKQMYSLEKITLITILRWNPHWLLEQKNIAAPPPILSHKNEPMTVCQSFNSHKDYVRVIGDLLLMEIWECITQAFNRPSNNHIELQFRIESCPLEPPAQDRHINLSNMVVNLSLPTSEMKHLPRIGDILTLDFGPENARTSRFVYVHNLRHLPSPPNNINSFYSISLNATYTEKMKCLKPGELVIGRSLACIKNELFLFEAIEYLADSPLCRAILCPQPEQYSRTELYDNINLNSQWTMDLNPSQKLAVKNSVSAALGDRPAIQMVQGPPGTGKSSVICAIVMTYLFDLSGKKRQNTGKILICATSNAAVDELVIRLLKIRQNLPKSERFRMVRVGRLEAMHEQAADVSSQRLAQRGALDAGRGHPDGVNSLASEEICRLEAKVNMWREAMRDAKEPERVAYCQGRISDIKNRLNLLRSKSSSSERLVQAERRCIERADVVVTTLASSHNFKMKGLKGNIALCIVDEAGQAIEPETLIPLTLGVARLTLVGDPQQLPGYICSQVCTSTVQWTRRGRRSSPRR
ncbi:probable helicase senataxin isoform X1 [Bicyclus anynana]|uniref:Probable helicase senataxin isoform X1 n=1 Tax=Bicyclus anynana TaxID=110368 RepID=A0A6J1MMP7_BICAN|nr:probable helicase senataxin isoform X1 [Bicyclus anynana]XP_023934203.2 probable helicase senataxin isoform X1 [Bicyclus anynana]